MARKGNRNFKEEDFCNLPKYHKYLRLMIDGIAEKAFSAITLHL
jgi:hypothetical protein